MSEEQIKSSIRGFLQAITAGDVNKSLSFVADDAVWVSQVGTLNGVAEIKNYLNWIPKVTKDYKVTETGIGIIVQGNTGIIEHNFTGVSNGKKWEMPTMCIYEFKDDKIITMRTFTDRLSLAQQVANGMFAKWAVNSIVNATQRGLH